MLQVSVSLEHLWGIFYCSLLNSAVECCSLEIPLANVPWQSALCSQHRIIFGASVGGRGLVACHCSSAFFLGKWLLVLCCLNACCSDGGKSITIVGIRTLLNTISTMIFCFSEIKDCFDCMLKGHDIFYFFSNILAPVWLYRYVLADFLSLMERLFPTHVFYLLMHWQTLCTGIRQAGGEPGFSFTECEQIHDKFKEKDLGSRLEAGAVVQQ